MNAFYPITMPEWLLGVSLLILIALLTGPEKRSYSFAFTGSLLSILLSIAALFWAYKPKSDMNSVSFEWLTELGNTFSLYNDGTSALLCLLTAISVFCSVLITPSNIKNKRIFFVLLFCVQLGLQGVFLAWDMLGFYIFFEIVLIPSYFLSIYWGNKKSLGATYKFFIYTFLGSLLMLGAIILIYVHNPSFSQRTDKIGALSQFLNPAQQAFVFIAFMLAFAIKMPIFPFHTWQPKLYQNAPAPVVLILSAVMVKMGLFGIIRFMLPLYDTDFWQHFAKVPVILSAIGVVYASVIALKQTHLRGLVAYSSIAHIGLMSVAILVQQRNALEGAVLQMFNHGINIAALWIIVDFIERKYKSSQFSDLQGLISHKSALGAFFMIASLANIALPVTNSFVGEFPMLAGIAAYNIWLAAVVGISVILSAGYMLLAASKIVYGPYVTTHNASNLSAKRHYFLLTVISLLIFAIGIYSEPLFTLIRPYLNAVK